MQKRAMNVVLTGVTGTALAGMLVAGVAAASDDNAPKTAQSQEPAAAQQQIAKKGAAADEKAAGKKAATKKRAAKALVTGTTTASYFWDDGSGVNGDTGAPASGKAMQKGLFASPSWPMNTKVKVTYKGRTITGFVGDRGPGEPSTRGVMLDLDTYTFRYLLDGKKPASKYNAGTGEGHLSGVKYEVLKWGSGAGTKGKPVPFGS
ncbi:RlpA-like double-psi beta-barrel domain-containing protein [Actinomadura parmotrematis]|uniref:RlpA-like double-psi beta-barrel domain-containing protein n=1 Tax=Actinomadura parmotrematis TaxID=2864039 RepID=A0ABS7G2S8_9ACTN|nr:RlpA-like double-psi beta-barrel domain-containing protein [Actinomadura parmotrematis]MBW8486132.1 RlpA-like double-psi beta-barrel domain-containing protein [Actinomadura parmotrematis]